MTVATGDLVAGTKDEFTGKGMELFQALIEYFVPSEDYVALPMIFKEWHELFQKKDETAAIYSGHVSKLSSQSKQAGQEYTEVSQILTFVSGGVGPSQWILRFHERLPLWTSGTDRYFSSRHHSTCQDTRALDEREAPYLPQSGWEWWSPWGPTCQGQQQQWRNPRL
jgi:hypothetical protein